MEQNQLLPVEPLIPQTLRMRLIEWVKNPTQNSLQAETTVTQGWPLNKDGGVSCLICVELVAQTVAALSTWRRGGGAEPRVGLLVGVKEAEFSCSSVPVQTRLTVQIDKLYHVGDYAVFQGRVNSQSTILCKVVIQVTEPKEDDLSNLIASQRIDSGENERENGER